ncbi:MAG: HEAT repeat domain-containing protein, partial [Myxococcota bacterium]
MAPVDLWEGPAARWPDGRPTRYNCPLVPPSCCKILLLLSSLLLLGFEWEGRLERLERELEATDPARRREVVRLLASYPAPAVREALLHALGDPDAGVRTEAAEAAGRVRLKEAVPRLLDWLGDADADVRTSAARALGE